jgi:serine/threonine protein kinase
MIVSPGGIAGWKIKISDFGISKPLEAAVHSTINGDAFRETAAALEMLGIHATSPAAAAATDGRGHVVREQSADIYHVGELAYLLLTREPPFADASGLTNYLLQPDNVFPSWIMRARGASDASVDFARVAMRPVPETRPTVRQALEHAWTKPRATTNVHFLAEFVDYPLSTRLRLTPIPGRPRATKQSRIGSPRRRPRR